MYKGLIFDLDGVLVDTAKYHYLAWKDLAQELGIEFTLEDNERLKGVSRIKSFQIILEIGGIDMPLDEQEIYCTKKNAQYVKYIEDLTKDDCLTGAYDFIIDAKKQGYKIALGSASKNAGFIIDKLELTQLFDALVDGTSVSKAKPDPEVFIRGAELMGIDKRACIVFEDAVAGIDAAHGAGMLSVGIGSKEQLPEANHCFDCLGDVDLSALIGRRGNQ